MNGNLRKRDRSVKSAAVMGPTGAPFIASCLLFLRLVLWALCCAAQLGPWGYREQTLYSDLVVRGVVQEWHGEEVPVQEWMTSDPRDVPIEITVLDFKVEEVLKGRFEKEILTVVVPGGYPGGRMSLVGMSYDYEVGDEMVLALDYWKYMRGGSFMLRSDEGRFVLEDGRWVNRGPEAASLTLNDIRKIIDSQSPGRLAAMADFVGLGMVERVSREDLNGEEIVRATVRIDSVWKGMPQSDHRVSFLIRRSIVPQESYWLTTPGMGVGEEWILFLKKDESGYYPFAGANGLLRVDGDDLIISNRASYGMTKSELLESVRSAVRQTDRPN